MPEVVKSTTSPIRSGYVVYDVWVMTKLQSNRRIASKATLREAHEAITPEHRKEYVYILKWEPATRSLDPSVPVPTPTCTYLWGCLCDRVHTNDLRPSVRKVLRS